MAIITVINEKTNFLLNIEKGKVGERIFEEDYLLFKGIHYQNVTHLKKYQVMDIDFITANVTNNNISSYFYEIKTNYKDDKYLQIEEDSNVKAERKGWFYRSKAHEFVFISKITHCMIMLPKTDVVMEKYEEIKDKYELYETKCYNPKNGGSWTSTFRRIPLKEFEGMYAMYKKSQKNEG